MQSPTETLDYQLLFEGAPGHFLILDTDAHFTILGASDNYLRATMTTRAGIVGRGVFDVFPDNPDNRGASGASSLRASLDRVLATRAPDTMAVLKYDIRRPLSEGGEFEERFWSPMNVPILAADGSIKYILHRAEDVTEFVRLRQLGDQHRSRSKELEERTSLMEAEVIRRSQELDAKNKELRAANAKLSELDQAKTAFFSNISHEFRTPLTLLLGPVADSLSDRVEPLTARHRERLELVDANAQRLLKLVNSLLDFSRIEAGRMRGRFQRTDLAATTRELVSLFSSAFDEVGLGFEVDCPTLASDAWVDGQMWEKMVLNLVSNAFKFTFEGGVQIQLRETADAFVLSVKDTGIGIPEHELSRVFERFHRIEGARSRSHEGSGIGLSLVHEFTKLHGGSLSVESKVGAGTQFVLSIPRGRSHIPDEAVDDSSAASDRDVTSVHPERWIPIAEKAAPIRAPLDSSVKKPRVLLVDDNADLQRYISGLLEPHYAVEIAVDGLAALDAVRASPPDIVVSDVMMPRLDGLGLVRALRDDPRTISLPVILVSARANDGAVEQGLASLPDDYLVKPFSASELLARVLTHLKLSEVRRVWASELERANKELDAFSYSVSHDLRAPLRAIDGFSRVLLSDCSAQLDERGKHYLQRIRAGTERMSMLVDDLLALSRISRSELHMQSVDLSLLATEVFSELRSRDPARMVDVLVGEGITGVGDARLLRIVFENLLGNAWKFTSKRPDALIEFTQADVGGEHAFVVRDNGAGFDMAYVDKLFSPFQRLHSAAEFDGTGIGLATVQRVIARHNGRVWVDAAVDRGATFYFTLGGKR